MDNKESSKPTQGKAEIPNFKLAKVGEKKERKGGGLPWLPGAGGQPITFASAILGSKAGIIAVVSFLSIGAIQYSNDKTQALNAASGSKTNSNYSKVSKPRADYEGDLSNLPKDPNARARNDGMSMVSGSLDGKTPEQRAAEAAAAAEKARLAEEAQAKADAEAQAKADAEAAAAQAQADAAAAAAPGQADASAAAPGSGSTGLGGGRIGSLSSGGGGGGGLSGGAGLSGGITKGFDSAKFGAGAGRAGDFKGSNKAGRTSATPGRGGRAQNLGRVRGRGISDRGLNRVAGLSRQAQAGSGETSAAASQSAFDGMRGGGSAITGAGAGAGGNPNGGSASGGPGSGSGGGGGTQSQPTPFTPPDTTNNVPETTCGAGTHIENGVCMPDGGTNVTEYQTLIDTAWDFLKYAGILLVAAFLLAQLANAAPWLAWLRPVAMALAYAAAALAAVATLLGLYICIKHGQWKQGLILTALGAITTYLAWQAAQGYSKPDPSATTGGSQPPPAS